MHDLTITEDYPWKGEGGEIVKKLVQLKDGNQWVVCAQRMVFREGGSKGRPYYEVHTIAIPAQEWSVAVIPQLTNILEARGATERNASMPPIELQTDLLDVPLPHNWLDVYVKDLITNVVSGKSVVLEDRGMTEANFLQKLFYCLICLPENLSRQISFGAGLSSLKEGEVRIAQVNKTRGLGKINDQRGGNAEEDVIFGQRYLVAIIQVIEGCTTPRQVIAAIQNIPQAIKAEVEGFTNAA